jgi:hypothetical protein
MVQLRLLKVPVSHASAKAAASHSGKMLFLTIFTIFNFVKECVSRLADFQDISGLAISGQENFKILKLEDLYLLDPIKKLAD